jgi:hypothetical protein
MQWHPSPQAIFKELLDKNAIKAKICEPPNEFSRKLWPSCLSFKLAVVGRGSLLRGGQKDRFAVNINSDVSLTPKIELHTVRVSVHCFLILIKNTMRDICSIFLQNWIKWFFYLFFQKCNQKHLNHFIVKLALQVYYWISKKYNQRNLDIDKSIQILILIIFLSNKYN